MYNFGGTRIVYVLLKDMITLWPRNLSSVWSVYHNAALVALTNRDVPDVIFLLSGRNRNRIVRNTFLTNKMAPGR